MKDGIGRALGRYQRSFAAFSAGQKVVAIVGTAAVLLAGFMVFRWASAPDYAPLYSNLASEDAAAIVETLEADGIPYELTGGGGTISVPRNDVYATRIALSGEGLPAKTSSSGGYDLLDNQDISTSEFKEQTDFKRAMEGELASTIEAIDGVETAVVHLALPPKEVFAEEQQPPTASVLLSSGAGGTLTPDQVQAVVHLVASSIDGLDPENVTVADSTGRVLSVTDGSGGLASSRNQMVEEVQNELAGKAQAMLDRVLGPGNATVQVTAVLDFDKAVTESTTFEDEEEAPALSETTQSETYSGGANPGDTAEGVVGPDGQTEVGTGTGDGSYSNQSATRDYGVDTVVEQRETAPGGIENLFTAVVVDANAPVKVDASEVENLVSSAIGIDLRRGDSIATSVVPFDSTIEKANEEALADAEAAAASAQRMEWIRNGVLILVVVLLLLLAWLRSRKNAKARREATTYVVEQLRQDQAERAAVTASARHRLDPSPATMALESAEGTGELRDELSALVERQPEEVAALLRGWLVERP